MGLKRPALRRRVKKARKPKKQNKRAMTAAELRRIRSSLGLSQAALATRLGVSPLTILLWEKGSVPIAKSRALAIQMVQHQEAAEGR